MKIGSYTLSAPTILAPMAGVTDLPFRQLCTRLGAGLAVSEMLTSNPKLWHTRKSRLRMNHADEQEPRSVQIAGSEPEQMAGAAQLNQSLGAQIIDINMGCPAKKVCNKAAGSALLKDPALVERILRAVVTAVDIPVTLKIRTGWAPDHRNGRAIAQLAEDAGIAALAVHGRTRACMFKGEVEYDTIADICQSVSIPVVANGDITSPEKAREVLDKTGAQAIMIGRAARGRPWIFREINHYLTHNEHIAPPSPEEAQTLLLSHIRVLHRFYGEQQGVRIARKHVGWYMQSQPAYLAFRKTFNTLETPAGQEDCINRFFDHFFVPEPAQPGTAEAIQRLQL
ncbi:tRNA dihydrouridine synthase DusB [Candidatus Sororendozoicomonas aggregata]|uniref:tRNA dihydrouridine synthase DusB n=1 Tax=Candidatus Sororendozoicomonas aggregata TaxID=3073239 RepID=UPI002ED2E166